MKIGLRKVQIHAKPSGVILLSFWIPWLINEHS